MVYRRELLSQMDVNPFNKPRFLDSLYRVNYTVINGSLHERHVMDSLWSQYQQLFSSQSAGIDQTNPLARSADDPPGATACAIPNILRAYFTDLLSLPNRYNTPILDLVEKMDPNIVGCSNAYATQIGVLVADMMYLINPDVGTCHSYQFQIETVFDQWLDCPLPEGPGTGGGGNGGPGSPGGGTSPEDPYPPVVDPEFDEINADPCASKNTINDDATYPGTMLALSRVKAKLTDPYEWGTVLQISDFTDNNTVTSFLPTTNENSVQWKYDFVWDKRNNVYTIGSVHNHHNDEAPSLQEIYNLAEKYEGSCVDESHSR